MEIHAVDRNVIQPFITVELDESKYFHKLTKFENIMSDFMSEQKEKKKKIAWGLLLTPITIPIFLFLLICVVSIEMYDWIKQRFIGDI